MRTIIAMFLGNDPILGSRKLRTCSSQGCAGRTTTLAMIPGELYDFSVKSVLRFTGTPFHRAVDKLCQDHRIGYFPNSNRAVSELGRIAA